MQESAVEVTARAGDSLIGTLIDLKAQAKQLIDAALPEPQAGLLAGILLGNQRDIAPDVSDAFAATGAAHVIAISGFNMAVLSGVIVGALRRLRVSPASAALISIAVIGVYTVFVGANPAVVRAALMSGLLVVGRALRRQTYLPASLAFAALVLSAINPLVLWDVSFQLSFFATLGMALFADPFAAAFDNVLERLFSAEIPALAGRAADRTANRHAGGADLHAAADDALFRTGVAGGAAGQFADRPGSACPAADRRGGDADRFRAAAAGADRLLVRPDPTLVDD